MSAVPLRRSARQRGDTVDLSLLSKQYDDDNNEASSSEDDEGIPACTPPKPHAQAGARLRPVLAKRSLEEPTDTHASPQKKARTSNPLVAPEELPARENTSYPTPESSRTAPPPTLHNGSIRASVEIEDEADVVDPVMVASVNMLCGSGLHNNSPGQQLRREEARGAKENRDDDDISDIDINESQIEAASRGSAGPELADLDLGVEPTNQQHLSQREASVQADRESDGSPSPSEQLAELRKHDFGNILGSIHPMQADIYEVPASPGASSMKLESGWVGSSSKLSPKHFKGKNWQKLISRRVPSRSKSNLDIHGGEKHDKMTEQQEASRKSIWQEEPIQFVNDTVQPLAQSGQKESLKDNASEFFPHTKDVLREDPKSPDASPSTHHEASSDWERESDEEYNGEEEALEQPVDEEDDADGSIEGLFTRDVRDFREQQFHPNEDSAFFDAPADGAYTVVPLGDKDLASAKYLMRRRGWTAIYKKWEEKLTEVHLPASEPARDMTRLLHKLERFCVVCPRAPHFSEQGHHFAECGDVLNFYYQALGETVDHIRTERLSFQHHANPGCRNKKARKKITVDLVRLVIPLLIRVLTQAWTLGGEQFNFTAVTVQLLTKLVGWSRKLYTCLKRELEVRPLEKQPESERLTQWKADIEARKALGPILEKLHQLLAQAPDRLQAKEESEARAESHRQWSLRRQQEILAEWESQDIARSAAQEEQNRIVVRSIRGEPLHPYHHAGWRKEEEISLCNQLQKAYNFDPPRFPRLVETTMTVGHSDQEVKDKATELLQVMFTKAYPRMSHQQIQSEVRKAIQQWR